MFTEWLYNIIINLFKKKNNQSSNEEQEKEKDAQKYYDISKENITAIVANALSVLTFGDCSVNIDLKSSATKRTEYLNKIAKKEFFRARKKVAAALGTGMIASIPYCANKGLGNRIYIDTISKERFWITDRQGDDIIEIVALSDIVTVDNNKYYRWTDYTVQNGVYIIKQKATTSTGKEIPLNSITNWQGIEPQIAISGVDRLPVAFYSCPISGRNPNGIDGKPITYGCDATLKKIADTLEDIEDEFELKQVKVFAADVLLKQRYDEKGKSIDVTFDDKLYRKLNGGNENEITVFDPAIRESAYFQKLQQHFAMLEKEIGCSKGVLTEFATNGATATEIRRTMNPTFCITDDMRQEYVNYFDTLIYSVNVLCNYYNITPISDYNINYDWNYSLLEDSEQTFNQLMQAKSAGAVSKVEIRQFVRPSETLEESKKAIEEIARNEPDVKTLLGMSE